MKPAFAVLLALAAARCAHASSVYAYVPASRQEQDIGTIAIPEAPVDGDIVVVGKVSVTGSQAPGPHPIYAVEIGDASSGEQPAPAPTQAGVPEGALWPDAAGHFPAASHPRGKGAEGDDEANPWVPRGGPRSAPVEAVFGCGAVIVGGEAGPVALVNGRAVKKGDAVGSFRVACVAREGAVLERTGALFVIPLGRVATVTLRSR
jgi:hypothetical protein